MNQDRCAAKWFRRMALAQLVRGTQFKEPAWRWTGKLAVRARIDLRFGVFAGPN